MAAQLRQTGSRTTTLCPSIVVDSASGSTQTHSCLRFGNDEVAALHAAQLIAAAAEVDATDADGNLIPSSSATDPVRPQRTLTQPDEPTSIMVEESFDGVTLDFPVSSNRTMADVGLAVVPGGIAALMSLGVYTAWNANNDGSRVGIVVLGCFATLFWLFSWTMTKIAFGRRQLDLLPGEMVVGQTLAGIQVESHRIPRGQFLRFKSRCSSSDNATSSLELIGARRRIFLAYGYSRTDCDWLQNELIRWKWPVL